MKTKSGLLVSIRRGDGFIWKQCERKLEDYKWPLETVIDIGAHVGCFSLAAAQKGAKRVWAFEPVKENFRRLLQNIINNGFWGTIIPMPFAVSRSPIQTVQIRRAKNSGQYSLNYKRSYPSEPCIAWNIWEFARQVGTVDYLKIDIEGAEWDLLLEPEGSFNYFDLLLVKAEFLDLEIHDLSNRRYFKMPIGETRKSMRMKLQTKLLRYGFQDVAINGEPLGIRTPKRKGFMEGRIADMDDKIAWVITPRGLKTIGEVTSGRDCGLNGLDPDVHYLGETMKLSEYLECFRGGGFPWQH